MTPVGSILALGAVGSRLARNVVEEGFRLVVANHGTRCTGHDLVIFLLMLAGAGLVARIVLLVRLTVNLHDHKHDTKEISTLPSNATQIHPHHRRNTETGGRTGTKNKM